MKYKPFTITNTTMDGMTPLGDFINGVRPSKPCVCQRRCGIEFRVIPKVDGTWAWGIWQFGGKYKNGWKYSNFTRQSQEGIVETFEEGYDLITKWYAKWMEESK